MHLPAFDIFSGAKCLLLLVQEFTYLKTQVLLLGVTLFAMFLPLYSFPYLSVGPTGSCESFCLLSI